MILVVDDLESNLQVAGRLLMEANYEVSLANNGQKAIEIAQKAVPDLILLDLVMPGIDGFGVCKALKSSELTKEIPIIFLTSMKDTNNIVKGFEAGAVDYIIKPANKQETVARIKTHLELTASRETILKQNEELKNLIEEKKDFLSLTSNHLMNPINDIRGYNEQIKNHNVKNENSEDLRHLTNQIDNETKALASTINDFLYLYELEEKNVPNLAESFNIKFMLQQLIKDFQPELKLKRLIMEFNHKVDQLTHAYADKEKVEVILKQLISNAIKYTNFYKTILIEAKSIENHQKFVIVEIKDQGVGMKQEEIKKVFDKYTKLSPQPTNDEKSVGLGMPIVKRLVEEIDGRILVESREGKGTSIKLVIPGI